MKRQFEWKNDSSRSTWYYFDITDGRIVGQVTHIGHTEVYVGKIIHNHNEEEYVGQFISSDYAKHAIEKYYEIQSRTLIE